MTQRNVYQIVYLNTTWHTAVDYIVAHTLTDATERAKDFLKEVKGHEVLGINFYEKIWI